MYIYIQQRPGVASHNKVILISVALRTSSQIFFFFKKKKDLNLQQWLRVFINTEISCRGNNHLASKRN